MTSPTSVLSGVRPDPVEPYIANNVSGNALAIVTDHKFDPNGVTLDMVGNILCFAQYADA